MTLKKQFQDNGVEFFHRNLPSMYLYIPTTVLHSHFIVQHIYIYESGFLKMAYTKSKYRSKFN